MSYRLSPAPLRGEIRSYVSSREAKSYHDISKTPTCRADGSFRDFHTRCGKIIPGEMMNDLEPRPSAHKCLKCAEIAVGEVRNALMRAEQEIVNPKVLSVTLETWDEAEAWIQGGYHVDAVDLAPVGQVLELHAVQGGDYNVGKANAKQYRCSLKYYTVDQVKLFADRQRLKEALKEGLSPV